MNNKIDFYTIREYLIDKDAFGQYCNQKNCEQCNDAETCYMEALRICNNAFAESIDYGGWDTEEEFWDNL